MDVKLDPSNYTAHALRQGGRTDMARHGVPSWHIEMTGRWLSKKVEENVHYCRLERYSKIKWFFYVNIVGSD